MTRLQKKYIKEVAPKMKEDFGFKNDFAVPKMQRVEVDGKVDATIFTIGFGETKKG